VTDLGPVGLGVNLEHLRCESPPKPGGLVMRAEHVKPYTAEEIQTMRRYQTEQPRCVEVEEGPALQAFKKALAALERTHGFTVDAEDHGCCHGSIKIVRYETHDGFPLTERQYFDSYWNGVRWVIPSPGGA
jgi:hypothetical protein